MTTIADGLAAILRTVTRPGDFATSGMADLFVPRIEVEGVGPVALPLLPIQAEQLVAVAERAPYGRGEETVVDTSVRRTWQIAPGQVRIEGRHWRQTLDAIVKRAGEGLGVSEAVEAEFYKLLVYDQGSFFVRHRDTEKSRGMFATLVLVLPSISTGGELVVQHNGREVRIDLRCDDLSEVTYAAFYADCVHEVLPVTSGCRLALVYNLVRRGRGKPPEPPRYDDEQAQVAALLQAWANNKRLPDDGLPEKLVYLLAHAYTPAELGFGALKGVDAAVAPVVVSAAGRAGCELHLALVEVEESGSAESTGYYRGKESFEVIEVIDHAVTASHWRRPDGSPSPLTGIPVAEEEFSPPGVLDDLDPDEEHFHEATGNEGASYDRTYRRAALVLWPRERINAVINQGGLGVTLPYLRDLVERWAAGGEDRGSPPWREAHDLSGHMLSSWPTQRWYPSSNGPSNTAQMLALLTALKDAEHLDSFLAGIAGRGSIDQGDSAAILGGLALLPADRAAALIERIVAGAAARSLAACGDLLARAAVAPLHSRAGLIGAATALLDAMPGDPARAAPREAWDQSHKPGATPGFVVDLFTALAEIMGTLAERATDHILAWPRAYDLDSVLVPAVPELLGSGMTSRLAAVQRLRAACVEHLNARVVQPLEAPRDWTRASKVACECPRCGALSRYLADPERKTWSFKASESDRRHVEETIKKSRCDLDVTTERRGRPYSLVCTKNQTSHERRVVQRQKDLVDLGRLKA